MTPTTTASTDKIFPAPAANAAGPGVASQTLSAQDEEEPPGDPAGGASVEGGGQRPRQVAGGAARPLITRQMMSDKPPSSPSGGASAARPPVAPSPAAPGVPSGARRPTSATPSGALYAGLGPLRVQLTAVATTVDDLVETVRDVLVKVEVLSGSQERLATAVHTMETSFTVAFKDVMSALQLMVKAAQGRLSSASGAVEQTLTAVSATKAAFREDEKK